MPSLAELLARDCVVQMESTIPAELTIAEWRRSRAKQRAGTRRGRQPNWRPNSSPRITAMSVTAAPTSASR